jgi:CrcB protein
MTVALVAVAGALGACGRAVLARRRPPWGVAAVNVAGSLVLGVVAGLVLYRGLGDRTRLVVGVGFCGAFTTFSTFVLDVVSADRRLRVRYAAVTVAGSLVAAAAGLALVSVLSTR